MSTIAHLSVAVSARVGALEKGFQKAQNSMRQMKAKLKTLESTKMTGLNQSFTSLRSQLGGLMGPLAKVAAGVSGIFLAKTAIGGAMQLEQLQVDLAVLAELSFDCDRVRHIRVFE